MNKNRRTRAERRAIRGHGNKLAHPDALSAMYHAAKLENMTKRRVNVYDCPICGALHVGRAKFDKPSYMFEHADLFEW